MGKDRGYRHSERERMKWNFNGYMPMQPTVNPEPPHLPTSGSNAQKKHRNTRVSYLSYLFCSDCWFLQRHRRMEILPLLWGKTVKGGVENDI